MFSTLLIVAGLLFDKSPNPADGMPIVQSIRHLTENQTGQVENYGAIMLFNRDLKKQVNVFTGMIFTEQYFSDELLNLTNDCLKLRLTNTVIRTSIITSKSGEIISPVFLCYDHDSNHHPDVRIDVRFLFG